MPRKPRRCVPGIVYHVISRFVDREWFISNELERRCYLELLGRELLKSDWRCVSYAVMSNHIHVAAVAGHDPLARWARPAHTAFADFMNREHKRIGNVFTRGPKSLPIPHDRVGHLVAYIHNNPVRAKVVDHAAASTWTSHRMYVGAAAAPRWLDVERGLALVARGDSTSFDAWVQTQPAHPMSTDPDETYEDIIARYEAGEAAKDRAACDVRTVVPPTLLQTVSETFALTDSRLLSKRRGQSEVTARAVVVRCCDALGFTSTQIARALHITPAGVLWLRAHHGDREDVQRIADALLARVSSR